MDYQFDDINGYCRALGHYVNFRYCRSVNHELPCGKIKDCWFEKIDIVRFISDNYTASDRERIFAPPPEKISTILDLIQKSREDN